MEQRSSIQEGVTTKTILLKQGAPLLLIYFLMKILHVHHNLRLKYELHAYAFPVTDEKFYRHHLHKYNVSCSLI